MYVLKTLKIKCSPPQKTVLPKKHPFKRRKTDLLQLHQAAKLVAPQRHLPAAAQKLHLDAAGAILRQHQGFLAIELHGLGSTAEVRLFEQLATEDGFLDTFGCLHQFNNCTWILVVKLKLNIWPKDRNMDPKERFV